MSEHPRSATPTLTPLCPPPEDVDTSGNPPRPAMGRDRLRLVAAWLFVGIPLAYGISQTVIKAAGLFTG